MVHFNGRPPALLSITLAPCRTDFWSADDTRRFRIAEGSMVGAHGDGGPRMHFEILDPASRGRAATMRMTDLRTLWSRREFPDADCIVHTDGKMTVMKSDQCVFYVFTPGIAHD
jgi:hypothetical protein